MANRAAVKFNVSYQHHTLDEAQKRFRKILLENHPDKHPDPSPERKAELTAETTDIYWPARGLYRSTIRNWANLMRKLKVKVSSNCTF